MSRTYVRSMIRFGAVCTASMLAMPCFADMWINEFQFNNTNDSNNFIEIVVTNSGITAPELALVAVELHDSSNAGGTMYDNIKLDDAGLTVTSDLFASYYMWNPAEIRNGAVNGIALLDPTTGLRQFFSWDGTLTATSGLAGLAGLTSTDVGFSQDGTTPIGESIGLIGTGTVFDDFAWSGPMDWTEGSVNEGQSFTSAAIPEPGTIGLLAAVSAVMATRRRRK